MSVDVLGEEVVSVGKLRLRGEQYSINSRKSRGRAIRSYLLPSQVFVITSIHDELGCGTVPREHLVALRQGPTESVT